MSPVSQLLANGLAAAQGRRIPFVFCYHGIGDEAPADDPHGLMSTAEAFAAHLDLLILRGYRLVGVTELWTAVQRGGRYADGLGAITIDDGLADTAHRAAELCAARGTTATLFLSPGLFGTDHPDLAPGRRILRADEVADLERSALMIGAHTHGHVELPTLSPERQLQELRDSRAELEELVGHPVTTMAYPYGRYDATTVALADRAGFEIACANQGAGPWKALALPREPVFASTTAARVRFKAAGLYGPARALRDVIGPRGGLPA